MIPELPPLDAPVQFDSDAAIPVRDAIPGLGHAIEFRVYRHSGCCISIGGMTPAGSSARAEALAQRFPSALRVLIQEAIEAARRDGIGSEPVELALVDLSTLDAG